MADRAPDSHNIICKICAESKLRIRAGAFKKKIGKTPKWVDETGKQWNGLTCPKCHHNQMSVRSAIKKYVSND